MKEKIDPFWNICVNEEQFQGKICSFSPKYCLTFQRFTSMKWKKHGSLSWQKVENKMSKLILYQFEVKMHFGCEFKIFDHSSLTLVTERGEGTNSVYTFLGFGSIFLNTQFPFTLTIFLGWIFRNTCFPITLTLTFTLFGGFWWIFLNTHFPFTLRVALTIFLGGSF